LGVWEVEKWPGRVAGGFPGGSQGGLGGSIYKKSTVVWGSQEADLGVRNQKNVKKVTICAHFAF
jgi:hypothetical protein